MRRINRPGSARWPAATVSVVCLAWLLTSAQGAAAAHTAVGAPPAAHAAAVRLSSPLGTGGSDRANLGSNGWAVQSSTVATQSGAQISTPGFNTSTWLPVSNDDAGAPGTEIEALL